MAQTVKHLPAMREIWVRSLGREDSLEKEMATSSCLENPMDGGAWWATAHRVAQSQTRLSDFTFTFFSLCLNHQHLKSLISCTLKRSYSRWPDVMVGNLYRQSDGEIQSSSRCFTVGLEDAVSLAEEGAGAPSRGIRGSADRLGRRPWAPGSPPANPGTPAPWTNAPESL